MMSTRARVSIKMIDQLLLKELPVVEKITLSARKIIRQKRHHQGFI